MFDWHLGIRIRCLIIQISNNLGFFQVILIFQIYWLDYWWMFGKLWFIFVTSNCIRARLSWRADWTWIYVISWFQTFWGTTRTDSPKNNRICLDLSISICFGNSLAIYIRVIAISVEFKFNSELLNHFLQFYA